MIKRTVAALIFLLVPVVSAQGQDPKVVDEIIALVDDDILLRSDVNGVLFNVMQQQQDLVYSDELWREAVDNLINQKVLATHARRDTTLEISADEVSDMLDRRLDQMARGVGGRAALEDAYGKSVAQIKADLHDDFEDQILAEQFQQRKIQKIRITPDEVTEWFARIPADSLPNVPESVRLSHIVKFAQPTEEARTNARLILGSIRDSIVTGSGSFEDMARTFSEDPGSAETGGLYAGARISEFVPEFAAIAARLPIGETSDPFETKFGLHILRVNDRRGDVVDLNQILVKFDQDKFDASEALEELEVLRDSVVNKGASFAALARDNSEEDFSASDGGRVSDPRTGDRNLVLDALGPLWRSTLILLDPGDVSAPSEVRLLDGQTAYHIVLLTKRIGQHLINLETDYELISSYALREKQAIVMEQWLLKLREDVFIDIRDQSSTKSVANK